MKPYGVKRQDCSCCEGHNPHGRRENSHAPGPTRKSAQRAAKKRARQEGKKAAQGLDFLPTLG